MAKTLTDEQKDDRVFAALQTERDRLIARNLGVDRVTFTAIQHYLECSDRESRVRLFDLLTSTKPLGQRDTPAVLGDDSYSEADQLCRGPGPASTPDPTHDTPGPARRRACRARDMLG